MRRVAAISRNGRMLAISALLLYAGRPVAQGRAACTEMSTAAHTSQPSAQRRSTGRQILRHAERLLLVAGTGLFVFLIYQLGPNTVAANLRAVGWGILLVVAQEIIAYAANTLGWRSAFPPPRPTIPLRRLLPARIAGDAVNYVTPTATLGGEFVRTRLLRGAAPTTSLVASVAVAKLTQTVGQVAFVIAGLALVINETPLPPPVRRGILIGLTIFSTLVVALVLLQRRGMFAPLLRLAHRLGLPARTPETMRRLEHLDHEIARFHGAAVAPFLWSSAVFFLGWCAGVIEIYLILWLLNVPATLQRALTIEVLSVAIDGTLFFVPLKAGTQEGGKVLIFTILGLDPAKGLALGIVRRIRELSWALIGLLILSRHHLLRRGAGESPNP
jgi:putative membrane protein